MTIKEQLQELRRLNAYIDSLIKELEGYSDTLAAVDYSDAKIQSSASGDLSDVIVRKEEFAVQINDEIDRYVDKKRELKEIVKKVLYGKQLAVINYRYFCRDYTWEQIAEELDCSYQNVHMLHRRALKNLKKVDSLLQTSVL